jgi:hypothetical protein
MSVAKQGPAEDQTTESADLKSARDELCPLATKEADLLTSEGEA